jgi:hypothetical protein
MKAIWILAAAATLAACHNRAEEETGAAPARGDTTAVTNRVDTTQTGVNAQPGAVDTSAVQPTTPDTSMMKSDTTSMQPAPTPAPTTPDTSAVQPTTPTTPDTSSAGNYGKPNDSSATQPNIPSNDSLSNPRQ